MTREQALIELGESTVKAIAGVLTTLAPDSVDEGEVAIIPEGKSALDELPLPAVAASVAYVDGVTGGNVVVFTHVGAKRLAAAMMGTEPEDLESELSELELSAVGEAMNQMMAAAAAGTGAALGTEVRISTPATTFLTTQEEAVELCTGEGHVTCASLTVLGEPCRLVQLVPNAFVIRMTRALDDLAAESAGGPAAEGHVASESLRSVPVRVWAELGRTRLPIGRAVGLVPGTVVDLDKAPDDPVDLFVSGRHFARGSLVLVDGEWAVEVLEIFAIDGRPASRTAERA